VAKAGASLQAASTDETIGTVIDCVMLSLSGCDQGRRG